ncbi:hypothetical protein I6A84_40685 [Frankia sp. CNm7]|uniref:Uncharacterized protein n=1 Tax=Frankia nepalensis TaxID=1836974 RepID=A0A937RMW4_9ACTN|nr:hypothetical protein [Frankia nepalensis]MBL7501921.1 hypothetical protein [Frankia nepalensis]MBL7514522.1 hypothetical protein [Frankia nepalensis]MBL7524192.1 hypothetical protein [Frankia nepalensis]MBL7628796.1 hypothetical protein [Frankia nepalensis]
MTDTAGLDGADSLDDAESLDDDGPREGGDPACWLARVCPECGLFAEQEPPTACVRCGAVLAGP